MISGCLSDAILLADDGYTTAGRLNEAAPKR